jgi:hypothetical protein
MYGSARTAETAGLALKPEHVVFSLLLEYLNLCVPCPDPAC